MQTVDGLIERLVKPWQHSCHLSDDAAEGLRSQFRAVAALAVDAERERERNAPLDDSPEPLMDPRVIAVQREMLAEVQKQTAEQKSISEAARAAMSDQAWISDANAALNGLLVTDDDRVFGGPRDVAKLAYDIADAMREEREHRKAAKP